VKVLAAVVEANGATDLFPLLSWQGSNARCNRWPKLEGWGERRGWLGSGAHQVFMDLLLRAARVVELLAGEDSVLAGIDPAPSRQAQVTTPMTVEPGIDGYKMDWDDQG
jgi:hypothetical protein